MRWAAASLAAPSSIGLLQNGVEQARLRSGRMEALISMAIAGRQRCGLLLGREDRRMLLVDPHGQLTMED